MRATEDGIGDNHKHFARVKKVTGSDVMRDYRLKIQAIWRKQKSLLSQGETSGSSERPVRAHAHAPNEAEDSDSSLDEDDFASTLDGKPSDCKDGNDYDEKEDAKYLQAIREERKVEHETGKHGGMKWME